MRSRSSSARATSRRQGMVLLVVMAMLALFASVAISFVFYADSEAEASRLARQAQEKDSADIDPELLAAYFLNQLLYPTDNIYSAMRGWDLATSIYGSNPVALNHHPYAGVGREKLLYDVPFGGSAVNNFNLINYTKYEGGVNPGDPYLGALRMPEFGELPPISGATNTNQIVITAKNHGLTPTDPVAIRGVQGNTAANGWFPSVTILDVNTFQLNGVSGNGDYTSGGVVLNLRAYRPANPPWTAYDTNSLFLAEVNANGAVVNPSFSPKWLRRVLAGNPPLAARKYMSLFPDPGWHPKFATHFDGVGDVKNLEFGPGGNDSKWMDLGFPVMTAPNGKRYKALFAPLIVDLSNRLHLWAHGNREGAGGMPVSNMGIGAPEVNLARAIGVPINKNVGAAIEVGGTVTITTQRNHRFSVGNQVLISGVASPGYDGVFNVTAVLSPTSFQYIISGSGLAPAGGGVAVHHDEWMSLFNLKYGGSTGNQASVAKSAPIPFAKAGLWYSPLDFDGLDAVSGKSSAHPVTGFQSVSTAAVPAGAQTMSVKPKGLTPFPWAFFDVVKGGTPLVVGDPPNRETVRVISVDPVNNTFTVTANFTKAHATRSSIYFNPHFAFPTYPSSGWENLTGNETANKPLGFNLIAPTAPNFGVVVGQKSLLMSNQEALMRFGGTNSPALTSEIFRRMPLTFSNVKARNMVTMWNMHFDRISASPFIPFDPLQPGHYRWPDISIGFQATYPTMNQLQYRAPDSRLTTKLPGNSEYRSDWRSSLGERLRVNLNRPLKRYPLPGPPNGLITNMADYNQALADRRNFASDIYNALVHVTGAQDPNAVGMNPTSDEYKASRWLAQLAVNIVDYIDEDDYMTSFNWDKSHSSATDAWVFGTEQPRLVLNEAYAQHELTQTGSGWTSRVNVWAELLNPLKETPSGTYPLNRGVALLNISDWNPYRVEIHSSNAALKAAMSDPANSIGSSATTLRSTIDTWGANDDVNPIFIPTGVADAPPTLDTKSIADPTESDMTTGVHQIGPTVTVIAKVAHNFVAGRAVTISNVPVVGYNGTFNITSVPAVPTDGSGKPTSFKYTAAVSGLARSGGGLATFVQNSNNGFNVVGPAGAAYKTLDRVPNLPATWVSPQMAFSTPQYRIAADPTGATIAGSTVTITTTGAHGLQLGDTVTIAGVGQANYNGTFTITNRSNTTFKYTVQQPFAGNSGNGIAVPTNPIALVLRRKANWHLPHDFNSASPTYNPWVTVDYLDGIRLTLNTGPATAGISFGRSQPYAATQVAAQTRHPAGQPFNTFFRHNSNADLPFKWLTHLDRPLVNQLELLHVSGVRPHELTHRFVGIPFRGLDQRDVPPPGGVGGPGVIVLGGDYQHYAPWDKTDALIYRALDLFGTPNHMAGTFTGGRWPGQINLNTITEPEIFRALCDAQDWQRNPLFRTASTPIAPNSVDSVYQALIEARNLNAILPLPKEEGNPFQTFAAANINKTWLRPGVFDVGGPGTHPYAQKALLQKMFNNITTTSNVFGVWWTAGYFEVVDESVRPARLGKEIGRDENRHIRHRFFAVVDRSGMELFKTRAGSMSTTTGAPWSSTVAYTVGDHVVLAGLTYRCVRANTGMQPPNATFWQLDAATVGTPWSNTVAYVKDTTVIDPGPTGLVYRCLNDNTGKQPSLNPTFWTLASVTVGAAWDSTKRYVVDSNVVYGGRPYRARQANIGQLPTSTLYWDPVTLTMNFNPPPTGAANGIPITIQPGMLLEIDDGDDIEVVSVLSVTGNSFTANFTRSHPEGAPIVCRGNPGAPAQRGTQQATTYNPRHDSSVVLHMSVIQ